MANKYDDDYTRVYWENLPSHNTPINQQNLNKMDAQIKTLTTRVSDMSTYIPNIMYVDELPEQGVEGLLYVTALIEHGFELTGLPERYQSQSALDTWINQGNYAFMLHLSSVVTDDTYAIIENVLVQTVTALPDTYSVSEINGNVTTYYLYNPNTKTWDSSTYGTLSVNDIIVGIGQANINSKLPSHYYATEGVISETLGIENIIGDMTISSHISTHAPTITYTDDDNTYEIYQAKPIRVLDPRNVYMWNDDTHSFFGFQKEYEAGQNITFTQQGTKVIISSTGGDGGVVTFTYNKTEGTVTCDTLWQDIINKYNAKTLKVQIREIQRNSAITRTVNLTQFKYGGGTTNDMYFEYLEGNILTTYLVVKNPNPNLEAYTITTITKDISGGGGGTIPPIIFYSDPNAEVRCTLTYEELKTLYDNEGATLPIYLISKGTYESTKDSCFAMNQLNFYSNQFNIYFNLGSNTTSKYMRVEYTTNNLSFIPETRVIQKQLTQGTGINIASDGTISVSFAQAEGGGF